MIHKIRKNLSSLRALWALYFANALSLFGNVFSELAIPWFVYELTGSALATAGVAFAGQLPNILVGIFSGHFIDRFNARLISLFSDALNFFAVALIPFLFHLGFLDILLLGLLVFLSKVFDTPGSTARQVMLAELIEKHQLPRDRVNGSFSFIETLADLTAPILAGVLLALIGAVYLLIIDAVTFALSFFIIAFGYGFSVRIKAESSSVSIWAAWQWLAATKTIRNLAIYDALLNTVATSLLAVALPILASELSGSGALYGVWMASFAAGTTLTTALYTMVGHKLNPYRLLSFTPIGQLLGLVIVLLVIKSDTPLVLASLGLFIFGANLGVGSMLDAKLLQTQVPEDRRGTVFAAFSSIRYLGVPVGLLAAGYFLEEMNIFFIFFFWGILCLIASGLWCFKK